MNRRATRYDHRDANEPTILEALIRMGVAVYKSAPLDLLVFTGSWVPTEIKTEDGRLTPGQKDFIADCIAAGRPYYLWRSVDDCVRDCQGWMSAKRVTPVIEFAPIVR